MYTVKYFSNEIQHFHVKVHVENKFIDTDISMKCISNKVISIEITSSTGKCSTVTSNSNIKLIESLVNPWKMAEIVLICRPCCLAHFLFKFQGR
jgi:hypothetical protein